MSLISSFDNTEALGIVGQVGLDFTYHIVIR